LAYIQALHQKKVLFKEKFERWENSPILISLYEKSTEGIYTLSPATVLKDIQEPTEPFIRNLLNNVYQNYESYEDKERIFNTILNELFQPEPEKEEEIISEISLEKTYPWVKQKQERGENIHNYAF